MAEQIDNKFKEIIRLPNICYYNIAGFLIDPKKKYLTAFFHKIFNIFKNSHQEFLKITVNYYIRSLQILYNIDVGIEITEDNKYMIQDKILSTIMKKNIKSHNELKDLRNNDNKIIEYFDISNPLKRKLIYFLAIFNGYIWYSNMKYSGVHFGYNFQYQLEKLDKENKNNGYECGIYKLSDLHKKRIACMDMFELYTAHNDSVMSQCDVIKDDKSKTLEPTTRKCDNLYILSDNASLGRAGLAHHCKDLRLVKIF